MITELNERSQAILRFIVDSYMECGEPVGSRYIFDRLGLDISPATIRNIMAELEQKGLLHAPHTSAGRMPTPSGLRLYVDGLMEIGDLAPKERKHIEELCAGSGHSINHMYERASTMLSGLSSSAGLVVAPKMNKPVRQIQFVQMDSTHVMAILVMQDGLVENRVMEVEEQMSPMALDMAAEHLNRHLSGNTLAEAQKRIEAEIRENQADLDDITKRLIKKGLATYGPEDTEGHIFIRGQSQLLNDLKTVEDLEKAQRLLDSLEDHKTIKRLIGAAQNGEGVQVFIGAENDLFEHSGWSMVISPYKSGENKIIGAIGIIGPTRLNYSRVVPILDYTSKVMERLLG